MMTIRGWRVAGLAQSTRGRIGTSDDRFRRESTPDAAWESSVGLFAMHSRVHHSRWCDSLREER